MSDQPAAPEQQMAPAVIEEQFAVDRLDVIGNEPNPGAPASVAIRLLVGPLAPNLYMQAKRATLPPDLAIALGEHLIKEGRRVKTGLVPASLADLPSTL